MKQFLPALLMLFIGTLCLNKTVSAQDSSATRAKEVPEEEWDKFVYVPMDGEFPGGDSAWQKFVTRKLVYPKKAAKKKIQGTVTVQFILGKDGTVLEATAINGPDELRQSAVDVVMRSPKWIPAMQSGRQVKAYKKRDIVFELETQ
jgi:periplasmic protein TonB